LKAHFAVSLSYTPRVSSELPVLKTNDYSELVDETHARSLGVRKTRPGGLGGVVNDVKERLGGSVADFADVGKCGLELRVFSKLAP
jgi:hypothetical protein